MQINSVQDSTLKRGSVTAGERSLAPDLARGFMLLLIAIAHAPLLLYGLEPGLITRPLGVSGWDRTVDFIALLLVDNRAYPMFAALFGYGMAMMVNRQLAAGTPQLEIRRLLRRRGWFLLLFGFVHTVLIGGADILALYGISALLVGRLLFREDPSLLRGILYVSVLFLILLPALWIGTSHLTAQFGNGSFMTEATTYLETAVGSLFIFPFIPLMQMLLWPMVLTILIGIWAGRKRLLDQPQVHRQWLRQVALLGISISIIGGIPLALIGAQLWNPEPTVLGIVNVIHIISGLAGGFGYASLFGLIALKQRYRLQGRFSQAVTAMGKRSLTFYLLLEGLLVLCLAPYALGLGGTLGSTGGALTAIAIWCFSLALAYVLEQKELRGPADALLRKLVYRNHKKQRKSPSSSKSNTISR